MAGFILLTAVQYHFCHRSALTSGEFIVLEITRLFIPRGSTTSAVRYTSGWRRMSRPIRQIGIHLRRCVIVVAHACMYTGRGHISTNGGDNLAANLGALACASQSDRDGGRALQTSDFGRTGSPGS
eukprot:scaffold214994_cov18-Prasinocladus_malaysianus.AAC.1